MRPESGDKVGETAAWRERLKLLLAVFGTLGPIIAIAAFLGLQPEKRKALEWEYVAETSVVNASASNLSITVLYGGRQIQQLTTVSARLANTGGAPIQETDVESTAGGRKYPSVDFGSTKAKVLNCDITGSNRPNITASCAVADNSVRLEHGLLNPGDSISVEIRLEGDPGDIHHLPRVTYRIAGIPSESTRYPSAGDTPVRVALLSMPLALEWAVLAVASALPIASLFLFGAVYRTAYQAAFPPLSKTTDLIRQVLAGLDKNAGPADLQAQAARVVHASLPGPIDRRAQSAIEELVLVVNESPDAFINRAEAAASSALYRSPLRERLKAINGFEIVLGSLALLMGIAASLVVGAAWVRAVAGR